MTRTLKRKPLKVMRAWGVFDTQGTLPIIYSTFQKAQQATFILRGTTVKRVTITVED